MLLQHCHLRMIEQRSQLTSRRGHSANMFFSGSGAAKSQKSLDPDPESFRETKCFQPRPSKTNSSFSGVATELVVFPRASGPSVLFAPPRPPGHCDSSDFWKRPSKKAGKMVAGVCPILLFVDSCGIIYIYIYFIYLCGYSFL